MVASRYIQSYSCIKFAYKHWVESSQFKKGFCQNFAYWWNIFVFSLIKIGLKTKIFHQHAKFWQQDSFLNCGDSSIFLSKIWIHFWYIYVSYDWKFLKVLKRILVLLRTCSCVKNDDANSEKKLSSVENIGPKKCKM